MGGDYCYCSLLAEDADNIWNDYVYRCEKTTVFHLAEWRRVIKEDSGHSSYYLIAREQGKVRGILPLIWVRGPGVNFLVSSMWVDGEGVVADNGEVARQLVTEAIRLTQEKKAKYLELRNYYRYYGQSLLTKEKYVTFILALEPGIERVWERLKPSVRNKIRKAGRSGITIDFGRVYLDAYYQVFAENMRDLGTPTFGKGYFKAIIEMLPGHSEIAVVKKGKKVIGGTLFLTFKDTLYVPFASSLRRYHDHAPNNLLYWELIRFACEGNYRYIDFGRSALNTGPYQFKEQWGAKIHQLYYQYYLNTVNGVPDVDPNNPQYRLAIAAWKQLPLWLAKTVGPHIIKYIA